MLLYYAFHDGPWRFYLNQVGLTSGVVSVPMFASWQTDANTMRVTTEAHINAKLGNRGVSIRNSIHQVTFLGDAAIMIFLGLLDSGSNGGTTATQIGELALLSSNCFSNPVILNLMPESRNFTQARVGRNWLNSVLRAWHQVTPQTFHIRPDNPLTPQNLNTPQNRQRPGGLRNR